MNHIVFFCVCFSFSFFLYPSLLNRLPYICALICLPFITLYSHTNHPTPIFLHFCVNHCFPLHNCPSPDQVYLSVCVCFLPVFHILLPPPHRSSPDSGAGGGGERGGERPYPGYSVSPMCLYKLLVPLLRCDATDMREAVTLALGKINHIALR